MDEGARVLKSPPEDDAPLTRDLDEETREKKKDLYPFFFFFK